MKALILTIALSLGFSLLLSALRLQASFPFIITCFVVFCLPIGLASSLIFSKKQNVRIYKYNP